jgi:RNA-directed DNA polymerase
MPKLSLVRVLAKSFLAGDPNPRHIAERARGILGRSWPWLLPLARRWTGSLASAKGADARSESGEESAASLRGAPDTATVLRGPLKTVRPRHRDVVAFILKDAGFERACSKFPEQPSLKHWLTGPERMQPVPAAARWPVPVIETAGALADWFWLEHGDLLWFADYKGLGYKTDHDRLQHYHYRVLSKSCGGNLRLIEIPKERLKKLQRQILEGILDCVPVHRAAHGFVKGRSIKTFTAPHVAKRVVLRMDLRDFFPSIAGARIEAVFRTMGYPETVAALLAGMCTNTVPPRIWNQVEAGREQLQQARTLYARVHLPQGAPTSPALANLCAYHLDCRLAGLAKTAGAEYTRYADDLAFSGDADFAKNVDWFAAVAASIASEEGFAVHHRKTRVMRQGVRQHLAGIVVNQHVNVMRPDYDRLKAILTNCLRSGPETQNRDDHPHFRAHLEGRIAFLEMINPAKGQRLRSLFEQINWG